MAKGISFLNPRKKGSALLLILIILGIAAIFLVSGLKSISLKNTHDKITEDVLSQAKDALIGYSTTYGDRNAYRVFGHLPCPDLGTGTEGNEASSCSSKDISAIGRLPWKTLGLPPLRDGSSECLWYAVSGSFKNNTKPNLLSWDSDGQFQILGEDGTSVIAGTSATVYDGTHPVAIIFSAGSILPGQDRTAAATGVTECGGNYSTANYLDTLASINNASISAVANAITQIISGKTSNTYNDRLLFITQNEIFAKHIEKRSDFPGKYFNDTTLTKATLDNPIDSANSTSFGLLQKTAQCLVNYGKNNAAGTSDKRLPWAAPLNIADFANDSFDDNVNLLTGRPPFRVGDSDVSTTNTLVSSGNSYRLLTINNCPNGWNMVAGDPSTTSQQGWWDKWKDHLFYAVADAFKPSSTIATQTYPCSAGTCLTVDGVGPYAAVLMYAGKKLALQAQNRDTLAQKMVASNYLEGINATSITSGTGTAYTKITSATANDVLICINQDLTLDPTCANPVIGSAGGGGVYTGIVPPEISQNPGWTGDTGLGSVTLADGTIISVTTTSGNPPTIYVSNTGIGVNSDSGANSLNLGNGEQMSFTFTSGQHSLAVLVGMLKNNDEGYITFKNNGTTVGTATLNGCTSSNTSLFNDIVPAGSPVFNQVILTAGTHNGYYINQVTACATETCAITGSGATGATTCTSWTSP